MDGGHIPTKDKEKRSFEALSALVYRPENVHKVDNHHRQITDKSRVVSALEDDLKSIKTYLHYAALKQGLTEQTRVTVLADGANNCWSVILALKLYCQSLECILDWLHIAKKFQNVKNALGDAYTEAIESAKWTLWHGDAREALRKITFLRNNIPDENKQSRLEGLHDIIWRTIWTIWSIMTSGRKPI